MDDLDCLEFYSEALFSAISTQRCLKNVQSTRPYRPHDAWTNGLRKVVYCECES
ncbi:unnamed protein product [Phytomonas sp. EM1]|nr:unnamed protein product [Phytomonas sp. EM1]|eukprot:CCW62533.1 unnamed protein product [Phytomonas sp. isolate EM1]